MAALVATPRGERIGRQRLAEIVTLDFVAAMCRQKGGLQRVLDTLGDRGQLEAAGECDDGADDRLVAGVTTDAGDEGTVDLQRIDGQALQVGERGVARAEIVDGQMDAEAVQVFEVVGALLGVVDPDSVISSSVAAGSSPVSAIRFAPYRRCRNSGSA